MKIDRIHHVAYRCKDARETVEWYGRMLHMDFVLAIAEDEVPSTKQPDPYMHVFLDAGQGNVLAFKRHLEANGVEVLGVTDHGMFHSIYFFDPNGHRVELACPDPEEAAMIAKADAVKWQMLEEWSRTKRAPRQGAFLHEREFNPGAAS